MECKSLTHEAVPIVVRGKRLTSVCSVCILLLSNIAVLIHLKYKQEMSRDM